VLLQAALNGPRTKAEHQAVPVSADELARDAVACVAAGARSLHLHPRDAEGRESLDPEVVNSVVSTVREAAGVPVGVTSGAWIEPDLARRLELVRGWSAPDFSSVNVREEGAADVMRALTGAGVGIEAGVWSVEDAHLLGATGLAASVTRVLVEPVEAGPEDGPEVVAAIHAALDELGVAAPRLQHGDGDAAWVLIADAIRRGLDTRAGLEDTLRGPDGEPATGNEALVRAARALGAGAG
jgi:uncharacterized protein (DUF849 family)